MNQATFITITTIWQTGANCVPAVCFCPSIPKRKTMISTLRGPGGLRRPITSKWQFAFFWSVEICLSWVFGLETQQWTWHSAFQLSQFLSEVSDLTQWGCTELVLVSIQVCHEAHYPLLVSSIENHSRVGVIFFQTKSFLLKLWQCFSLRRPYLKFHSLVSKQLCSGLSPLKSLFKSSSVHEQLSNHSVSFFLVYFGGLQRLCWKMSSCCDMKFCPHNIFHWVHHFLLSLCFKL